MAMSREDIFDCMQHWRRFRDAGVAIVTCQRGELNFDNLGGVITAIVDQYGARDESIKLAHRVASGQRLKVQQGQRINGEAKNWCLPNHLRKTDAIWNRYRKRFAS